MYALFRLPKRPEEISYTISAINHPIVQYCVSRFRKKRFETIEVQEEHR